MIRFFVVLIMSYFPVSNLDYNFNKNQTDWFVVVDGVMGGLSTGKLVVEDGYIHFYGKVSLENNGGFASIRNPYNSFDLRGFKKVKIRYISQGNAMAFTLNPNKVFYMPYYKITLPKTSEWKEVTIALKKFEAHRLGESLDYTLTAEDAKQIVRFGFITDEKEATSFDFKLDYIRFE